MLWVLRGCWPWQEHSPCEGWNRHNLWQEAWSQHSWRAQRQRPSQSEQSGTRAGG